MLLFVEIESFRVIGAWLDQVIHPMEVEDTRCRVNLSTRSRSSLEYTLLAEE